MRKPRARTGGTAPYQWQMPAALNGAERQETGDRRRRHSCLPKLDWQQLFGNVNPVEIEVGMGKGLFLLNSAVARPDANFFGIEIVRKYQLFATTRFAVRQLPNVKTVCAACRAGGSFGSSSRRAVSLRSTFTFPIRGGRRGTEAPRLHGRLRRRLRAHPPRGRAAPHRDRR